MIFLSSVNRKIKFKIRKIYRIKIMDKDKTFSIFQKKNRKDLAIIIEVILQMINVTIFRMGMVFHQNSKKISLRT